MSDNGTSFDVARRSPGYAAYARTAPTVGSVRLGVPAVSRASTPGIEEFVLGHQPEAALKLELGAARIVVVAAKRPGQLWDEVARAHIAAARASYRLWGDVPIWDHFDALESTSQYIAYVLYRTPDGRLEREAITGRLVRENPEDLSFYVLEDQPLAEALAARLPGGIAGDSRIGAIRPCYATCNAYTLEAFAAVRLAMMSEALDEGLGYVACQLRPSLDRRVLTRNGVRFGFPRTEALFNMPAGAVRLDRSNPYVLQHMFSYPGYFLDSDSVRRVLQPYVTMPCEPSQLHRLAPILCGPDPLGAKLQSLIVNQVQDGVYSSVVSAASYQDRAWSVLKQLGANMR